MTPDIKPLVCGNWKMNGLEQDKPKLGSLAQGYDAKLQGAVDLAICPPFTLVSALSGGAISIGAQDCHTAQSGAHTGDVSATMLADAGAQMVIVGHSERRSDHGEDDAVVRAKAQAVIDAGLVAIVCVGETKDEREAGKAVAVVDGQLAGSLPDIVPDDLVVAYEPVWAIGTGLVPSAADVEEMHAAMRTNLVARFGDQANGFRLLYGGSVKPANAVELMGIANVDGALVGGASLKPEDFLGIASAYVTLSK
ncbi:MAG: triose-phosphate isomerase [Pseudomonadota bacterium]